MTSVYNEKARKALRGFTSSWLRPSRESIRLKDSSRSITLNKDPERIKQCTFLRLSFHKQSKFLTKNPRFWSTDVDVNNSLFWHLVPPATAATSSLTNGSSACRLPEYPPYLLPRFASASCWFIRCGYVGWFRGSPRQHLLITYIKGLWLSRIA